MAEVFPEPIASNRLALIEKCVRSTRPVDAEEESSSNGTACWYRLHLEPLRDADGVVRKALVVWRDITGQRTNETELLEAKDRAERSERLKDAFIATISHKLRTPLNTISGYAQVIHESFEDRMQPNERRYFESIQRGSELLNRTVDEILNFTRLELGDINPELRPIDISSLVYRLVGEFRPVAQQRLLSLSYINEIGSETVMADEYYLTQVLHNLIDNAIKYTRQGSISVRLHFDAMEHLAVEVRDTGIGISDDYLPVLFEPYSTGEPEGSSNQGRLGLGLTLVRQYLHLHDATVTVESKMGIGSSFVIHFAEMRSSGTLAEENEPPPSPHRPRREEGAKPSVLVVEDDPLTLEYLELILSPNYDVRMATSASAALRLLRRRPIDIILMDISLKGKRNGIELTRTIRELPEYQDIPIVAVTAHAFPSDREACLEAGCNDYVVKPMSKRILQDIMIRLLELPEIESDRDGAITG